MVEELTQGIIVSQRWWMVHCTFRASKWLADGMVCAFELQSIKKVGFWASKTEAWAGSECGYKIGVTRCACLLAVS